MWNGSKLTQNILISETWTVFRLGWLLFYSAGLLCMNVPATKAANVKGTFAPLSWGAELQVDEPVPVLGFFWWVINSNIVCNSYVGPCLCTLRSQYFLHVYYHKYVQLIKGVISFSNMFDIEWRRCLFLLACVWIKWSVCSSAVFCRAQREHALYVHYVQSAACSLRGSVGNDLVVNDMEERHFRWPLLWFDAI